MAAPFTRANLVKGPAVVTYNGANFYTRDDVVPRHAPNWKGAETSMYSEVDEFKDDLVIKVPLRLWGAWENLSVLFPAAVISPVIGKSLFPASDLPLTILARNNDQIIYTAAAVTKLADLYLGVDQDLFAADVEFTCLIGSGFNPEDSGAYYTDGTGVYADSGFAKTNYKKVRWTAAWGSKTGFTTLVAQKGFHISWTMDLAPVVVDGYGTNDLTLNKFKGMCKVIPVGPTIAQLEAQALAAGVPLGTLLSSNSADLTITGSSSSLVLKNAGLKEHGYAFGQDPLRLGEITFETTRGFTAGAPQAVATVS